MTSPRIHHIAAPLLAAARRLAAAAWQCCGLPLAALAVAGCSTTSALSDDEQLFAGLKPIRYENYEAGTHAEQTKVEMESALASAPTGALFGSSYYRTPLPLRLWIWNAFSTSDDGLSRWITSTFGSKPKLMSQVSPDLRVKVAEGQLRKYGYFQGHVDYDIVTLSNPKKAKVAYTVNFGPLYRIDTLRYNHFPAAAQSLIDSTRAAAVIARGTPFSVPTLEAERQRVTRLFRNNGYYFYNNAYASYLADTLTTAGHVDLRLTMADSLDARALRPWHIATVDISFRRQFMEQLATTRRGRRYILHYNGRRTPLRMGALRRDIKLERGSLYSLEAEEQTRRNLQAMGLFSSVSLTFAPRDTTAACDSLDMQLGLVFDNPYDFYIEAGAKGKTSGRLGPELVVGMTKRNAFRGGEKLDVSLHGLYEWQTSHQNEGSQGGVNSYEYGADVSLVFPRILSPRSLWRDVMGFRRRSRRPRSRTNFYATPTTTVTVSSNVLNRATYFKRHVVSGELTYDWWATAQSHHTFTPLTLSYEYMQSQTARFDSLLQGNPYLQVSMRDQFVPKMSYTYRYTSASTLRNPISWEVSVSEAGNVLAGAYAAFGEEWSRKNKTMFKNPFAQFVKVETDFVKTWRLSEYSSLVGHVGGGVVWSYGNASQAPYYEQFYVGGANSVRAFNVRSIGPGKYVPSEGRYSYIDQTGDVKFLANLEYRPRLFGDLYGALFLDAGNVWTLHHDATRPDGFFQWTNFFRQLAVGTGVGLRYDLGMFVVRVDWGIGLHVPYETTRAGFYNVTSFRDAQSIHLAVGFPF